MRKTYVVAALAVAGLLTAQAADARRGFSFGAFSRPAVRMSAPKPAVKAPAPKASAPAPKASAPAPAPVIRLDGETAAGGMAASVVGGVAAGAAGAVVMDMLAPEEKPDNEADKGKP